jgi:hypothetical protein
MVCWRGGGVFAMLLGWILGSRPAAVAGQDPRGAISNLGRGSLGGHPTSGGATTAAASAAGDAAAVSRALQMLSHRGGGG